MLRWEIWEIFEQEFIIVLFIKQIQGIDQLIELRRTRDGVSSEINSVD